MFVLRMGRVPAAANPFHCSFQSSLKWLVYCACALSCCLSFSLQACAPIAIESMSSVSPYLILGQVHLFVLYLCTLGLGAEKKQLESTDLQIAIGNKVGVFPPCYLSQPFLKELSLTTSILQAQRWKHRKVA